MISELFSTQPDQSIATTPSDATPALRPWSMPRLQRLDSAAGTNKNSAGGEYTSPGGSQWGES